MSIYRRFILAHLFLLLLFSCAPSVGTLAAGEGQPAAGLPPNPESYQLGPEDILEISVWKEPELTKQVVVAPDGKISYPLIGNIQAAGRTVKQLQDDIAKQLEKFVTEAHVTVILMKVQFYKIYVTGLVTRPGEFLLGRAPTVMQAIAMAGGLTPFAAPSRIIIIRKNKNQDETFPFDYKAVSRGESLEQNRLLQPGDVVVVP